MALTCAQLEPKRGQKDISGHFCVQNTLVFAKFADYKIKLRNAVIWGGRSAERNFADLKTGHLVPILAKFMSLTNSFCLISHVMIADNGI